MEARLADNPLKVNIALGLGGVDYREMCDGMFLTSKRHFYEIEHLDLVKKDFRQPKIN